MHNFDLLNIIYSPRFVKNQQWILQLVDTATGKAYSLPVTKNAAQETIEKLNLQPHVGQGTSFPFTIYK